MTEENDKEQAPKEYQGEELEASPDNPAYSVDEVLDLVDTLASESRGDAESYSDSGRDISPSGRFIIPARPAAVGASFLAVACLTALVLVASAEGADALATIALALAVLAFLIQIVVFIYQSMVSNQQMLQSEQVFTETRALLTEVRTAARSTETLVREQFRDVLKAFLDASPPGKQGDDLLAVLRSELAAQPSSPRLSAGDIERARERSQARRRAAALFSEFPLEEYGGPVLEELAKLPPPALRRIRELAENERAMVRGSVPERIGKRVKPEDKALEQAELTTIARVTFGGTMYTVSRLTDRGRIAAALLLATGEIPAYAASALGNLTSSSEDPESPPGSDSEET